MTTTGDKLPTIVQRSHLTKVPSSGALIDAYKYARHPRHPHTVEVTSSAGIVFEVRVTALMSDETDDTVHTVLGRLVSTTLQGRSVAARAGLYVKLHCHTGSPREGTITLSPEPLKF